MKIGEDGNICVAGNRYIFSGTVLPHFRKWVEDEIGLDISRTSPPQNLDQIKLNDPIINEDFLKAIDNNHKFIYFSKVERLLHSHGHTCQDIWSLRYGNFSRCPDAVIYPGSHNDVEAIIKAAVRFNVVLIPYGGGTSVSSALQCPENENRMIVSLDMHEMNKIK